MAVKCWSFNRTADGSKFDDKTDPMVEYGSVKLTASLWMASMARRHSHIRFVTMSPGGTTGTNGMDDLPLVKKILFKYIGGALMPLFGMMHGVDVGAKRYVDGLTDPRFRTGRFYASKAGSPTGPVVDQASLFSGLSDPVLQDNARLAVRRFVQAPQSESMFEEGNSRMPDPIPTASNGSYLRFETAKELG